MPSLRTYYTTAPSPSGGDGAASAAAAAAARPNDGGGGGTSSSRTSPPNNAAAGEAPPPAAAAAAAPDANFSDAAMTTAAASAASAAAAGQKTGGSAAPADDSSDRVPHHAKGVHQRHGTSRLLPHASTMGPPPPPSSLKGASANHTAAASSSSWTASRAHYTSGSSSSRRQTQAQRRPVLPRPLPRSLKPPVVCRNEAGLPPADLAKSRQMEPTILSDDLDRQNNITETMAFIRHHIEFFASDDLDVRERFAKGGKGQVIFPGLIGVRCIHCRDIPLGNRPNGATSFPSRLNMVYQACRNWIRYHLKSCNTMSDDLKKQYKGNKRSHSVKGAEDYWVESCQRKGLYDGYSEEHDMPGIFFDPAVKEKYLREEKKRKLEEEKRGGGENSRKKRKTRRTFKKEQKTPHGSIPGKEKSPGGSELNEGPKLKPATKESQKSSAQQHPKPPPPPPPPAPRGVPPPPPPPPIEGATSTIASRQASHIGVPSAVPHERYSGANLHAAAAASSQNLLSELLLRSNTAMAQQRLLPPQVAVPQGPPLRNAMSELLLRLAIGNSTGGGANQQVGMGAIDGSIAPLLHNLPAEVYLALANGGPAPATALPTRTQEVPARADEAVAVADSSPLPRSPLAAAFPTGRLCSDDPNGPASRETAREQDQQLDPGRSSTVHTAPADGLSTQDKLRQIDSDIVKLLLGTRGEQSSAVGRTKKI